MSNRKKIEEIISEFKEKLSNIEAEEKSNVVQLHKGFPKEITLLNKQGFTKTIQHLQAALDEMEKTKNAIKQKAFEALSQEQMLNAYEELNSCADDHLNGIDRGINLSLKNKKNEWAEAILLYFELNENNTNNLNP